MKNDWLDSPEATEVLSMMCFQCIRPAQIFRAAGDEIATKAEAEQAFVLRKLLKHVREHGSEWRAFASAELSAAVDKVKATAQPKET